MRSILTPLMLVVGMAAVIVAAGPPGAAEEGTKQKIVELNATYRTAFEDADAAAFAACFAAEGEYIARDGTAWRGRRQILEAAAAFFARCPGATISARSGEIRPLGGSAAIAEGLVTVLRGDGQVHARTRYSIHYTREDDRWVIASLREAEFRTGDLSPRERLEPLAWLIGDWMDDSDQTRIRITCAWSEDGPWLIQSFHVTDRTGKVTRYSQRIGWDSFFGKIRSWSWDSDGGHGGAVWTPTDTGWLLQSRGTSGTGVIASATYRITKVSEDIYRWESTQNVVGNAEARQATHLIVRQPPEVSR